MKKLFIMVFAILGMAACTNEEDEPINQDPVEIKLSAGVLEVTTKAELSAFNNTTVGIYGIEEGETTDSYAWSATPYFSSTEATITSSTVSFATTKLYYPANDKKVKLFAYYPLATLPADVTGPTEGNAPKIAYTLTGQEDILYATTETGKLTDHTANSNLEFTHKLAKLNFKVVAGTGFPTSGIQVTSIKVTATQTAVSMDLGTGALTFSGSAGEINTNISSTEITGTESSAAFGDVMIQPEVTYGLEVIAGGITYTIPSISAISGGTAHTLTLTFKGSEIDATASITPWNPTTGGEDVSK